MFQNQRTLSFLVKGHHQMPAEFVHGGAHLAASLHREQIAMKALAGQRARYGTVRTDHAQIYTELLSHKEGKLLPSTRGNHDFYSHGMSPPDGRKIVFGNVELGVQQGAVNIQGKKADGKRCHKKF